MSDEIDLRPFGYAPGCYMFKCIDCPEPADITEWPVGSKRSYRCRDHALAKSLEPPPIPAPFGVKRPDACVGDMPISQVIYFLERFKREEQMLGPHEQWALDVAIAALGLLGAKII